MDDLEQKIIYVEWSDGKPFEIIVENGSSYDVDFTKDGGGYYHWSGGGISKKFNGQGIDKLPDGVTTFDEVIKHYDLTEGRTFWCKICESRWSEATPCKHVEWCEDCGVYHIPNKHN